VASSGEWPDDPAERADLESRWDPVFGDRQQELVFIGIALDGERLRVALDGALLTGAELSAAGVGLPSVGSGLPAGFAAWRGLPDPFPEWDLSELDGHELAEHGHVSSQTGRTPIAHS
jgi:hypothetical protein